MIFIALLASLGAYGYLQLLSWSQKPINLMQEVVIDVPKGIGMRQLGVLSLLLTTFVLAHGPVTAQEPEHRTICEIQGADWTSPDVTKTVTTEGIVTADFVGTESNGFFLQEPDCDDNPATVNFQGIFH